MNEFSRLGHQENHSIIQVGRYLCRCPVQSHAQGMGSPLKSDQVSIWAFKTSQFRDSHSLLSGHLAPLLLLLLLSVSLTGLF